MDALRKYSQAAERLVDRLGTPLKPYVPVVARSLLVVTFLEDSLRISTQWSDQVYYLSAHRGMWRLFAQVFLFANVVVRGAGGPA
ncbi:MAG: SURF4 family-domain-containing protein [Olpidium bornovanus]|uniref:SURF4 family-domain-containing protein n=1 Tax=Olpidium bornovanus TaxID=278681 RepID=A0A8H8DLJ4_9FUNG|nr:MAG: SURF4 family-domain-containing protein [Olpidium bornovanus]